MGEGGAKEKKQKQLNNDSLLLIFLDKTTNSNKTEGNKLINKIKK